MIPKRETPPARPNQRRKRRESIEHPVPQRDAGADERGGRQSERDTNVNTTRV